ncbi:MAG: aldehyde dehydrogenase family protein [Candidatus Dormibacteria bacterium]
MEKLNHIDGRWVPSRSGRTLDSLNPSRRTEVVVSVPRSTAADVDDAVVAAERAFRSWRWVPPPIRGEFLLRVASLMRERKEELARAMSREMGKVLDEARGDVQEGIDMGLYIAGEGRRFFGETVPSELRDKFCMTVREPLGVVGLITPWNFPVAIPTWKMFPALMAGNTVVFKPAEDTPLCATLLVEILEESGLQAGVVNLVHGDAEAGRAVVDHPGISGISFTGSTEVGRQVAEGGARQLKRVSLEMGGKNGIIVMDDARLDLALEGATWGAFGTSGQRCTASSRLIVHESVAEEFTERLVAMARALRVGDPLEDGVHMGPVVNEVQLARIHGYTERALQEGGRLLCGGRVLDDGVHAEGHFYAPTVFADIDRSMTLAVEEVFGPCTAVMAVRDLEEAIEVANATPYGLSLAIYTQDVTRAFHAIRRLDAGIVYVNAPTIGAEIQLPFGGVKSTGNGHREAGPRAMDTFSEEKAIYIDFSGRLQRAQIDVETVEGSR